MPRERGGAMPALAVTAYTGKEPRKLALTAGYQVHLTKPFDPAELMGNVATLAGMARLSR